MNPNVIFLLVVAASSFSLVSCKLQFIPDTVELTPETCVEVILSSIGTTLNNKFILLKPEFEEIATVNPTNITTDPSKKSWVIQICARGAGYSIVTATINNDDEYASSYPNSSTKWIYPTVRNSRPHLTVEDLNFLLLSDGYFLHVIVAKYKWLKTFSAIVGWIYFLAWSVSFYPQMYENYVRKSVVGLNFDFVALNVMGFALYSIFNCGLFYVPFIQSEYINRHPKGLNPVQFNDVFFSVHAFFATVIVIAQCYLFERGNQAVSAIAKMILVVYYLIILITSVLAYMHVIHWLDFLLYCSYIKLSVTLIKYIPQAVMNYTRKTTSGWSIGNVLLDFVGGSFSMAQMLLDGYNYNDWDNIFGDPTKFGLGLFSVSFDIFFLYQHYVLYRHEPSILTDTQITDAKSKSKT